METPAAIALREIRERAAIARKLADKLMQKPSLKALDIKPVLQPPPRMLTRRAQMNMVTVKRSSKCRDILDVCRSNRPGPLPCITRKETSTPVVAAKSLRMLHKPKAASADKATPTPRPPSKTKKRSSRRKHGKVSQHDGCSKSGNKQAKSQPAVSQSSPDATNPDKPKGITTPTRQLSQTASGIKTARSQPVVAPQCSPNSSSPEKPDVITTPTRQPLQTTSHQKIRRPKVKPSLITDLHPSCVKSSLRVRKSSNSRINQVKSSATPIKVPPQTQQEASSSNPRNVNQYENSSNSTTKACTKAVKTLMRAPAPPGAPPHIKSAMINVDSFRRRRYATPKRGNPQ